ncbi:MAG: hypothetical protein II458_09585, partial [Oscillospiraceae bacterium]|nr:hypothetical protein [Oscillospiraceae bacterium]
ICLFRIVFSQVFSRKQKQYGVDQILHGRAKILLCPSIEHAGQPTQKKGVVESTHRLRIRLLSQGFILQRKTHPAVANRHETARKQVKESAPIDTAQENTVVIPIAKEMAVHGPRDISNLVEFFSRRCEFHARKHSNLVEFLSTD